MRKTRYNRRYSQINVIDNTQQEGLCSLKLLLHPPVLLVEVVHVRHQVLDHVHVGQRVDLGRLLIGLNLGQARQSVHASCKWRILINITSVHISLVM